MQMAELARILLRRSELGRLQAAVQVSQHAIALARPLRLDPVSLFKEINASPLSLARRRRRLAWLAFRRIW